ncbi:alpha-amylase [Candidatus Kaiserbacteria bacterium RIFCSPHIGHO2_02_FULL_50_9]|nr:MAG: alpha-amylase [Candidatus Kaiserbacteria bacterium RIFCSPHIGHO2_01_FULL_51_33]OGG63494.1 MAG: alpha-amylase [Candidatus Kaiserbacteria bacterium RIFCSPHIGHO2_02_FULL_50_9]
MLSVCHYFHVHQPRRIKRYRVFDIGRDHGYFNDATETDLNNRRVLAKVAGKSYLPTNQTLQDLLQRHPEFTFSFSFSGVLLDQLEENFPEVLDSFKRLIATGRVEILADTHYHSLAFFYSLPEFERQIELHERTIRRLFGVVPKVLRNTELSYRNDLATWAEAHGYIGIMAEGWDHALASRSPNFLYRPPGCKKIKVLLKNYRLSDDVAFRFSERSWKGWPLTAPKFAEWVNAHHGDGQTVNLFMDYETFGEHQWEDSGIFHFLSALPGELLKHPDTVFKTPSQTAAAYEPVGEIDVPYILTWADTERDLSAWVGNDIQRSAIAALYALEEEVLHTDDAKLIEDWRYLQTSDHFYYMCTKWFADGDVHKYFNPYQSPYDAYIAFMNVLSDVKLRLQKERTRQTRRSPRMSGNRRERAVISN